MLQKQLIANKMVLDEQNLQELNDNYLNKHLISIHFENSWEYQGRVISIISNHKGKFSLSCNYQLETDTGVNTNILDMINSRYHSDRNLFLTDQELSQLGAGIEALIK